MRGRRRAIGAALFVFCSAGCGLMARAASETSPRQPPTKSMTRVTATYAPAAFKDLPGWIADDHRAAYGAFLKSCERLIVLSRTDSKVKAGAAHLALCVKAAQLPGSKSNAEARAFFERHFVPHRVVHDGGARMLTAYYEPLVLGSRTPTERFPWPLYKRPPDLVTIVDEANRGTTSGLTHVRQTGKGPVPFATRAEIEQGALKGRDLELMYVEHAVDGFFMQIQGSARVKLTDGSSVRIGYDGKNGHPYTSIGRVLIDQGEIPVERMSLQALQTWLKANPVKAREVMWANKSFVFFREHADQKATDPQGVHDIMLTPGRSLALDPSYHAIGLPVYVVAPDIRHIPPQRKGFQRLMIAQDVGSAIKGPERGDIYVGSGDLAGRIAGTTKHPGTFFVLLPRDGAGDQKPEPPAAAVQAAPGSTGPPATPIPAGTAATEHKPDSSETIAIKAPSPASPKSAPAKDEQQPAASQPRTGSQ
jgi:membrane-bound lytic murein transglycosylase A